MKLLVTGAAGFIGFHLTKRFAEENHTVTCIDNINSYYDVDLKYARLGALGFSREALIETDNLTASSIYPSIQFSKLDLCDAERVNSLFAEGAFDIVIHLAAQAGVRYSLTNPQAYISSNLQGFINILESAKSFPPERLIYASSSSVYGLNTKTPFSESDPVNSPASLYAATKRSNELMAYTYGHLYHIKTTGLRFFTVYGPWGRPDMAPFIFTKSILEEKPINVFNNGNMQRDFTYIDDIIEGIINLINPKLNKNINDNVPSAIYNIGYGKPVDIMEFIHTLEETLNKKAIINYMPMQKGDVIKTWADCTSLENDYGFRPKTPFSLGIRKFTDWYKEYYH